MKKSSIISLLALIVFAAVSLPARADDDPGERRCREIVRAAEQGSTVLRNIVSRGYDINMQDEDGETPLIRAAEKGRAEAVRVLLEAGADVNARDREGNTALMEAADEGHSAIVSLLIAAGADVTLRDRDGETALDKAVEERHTRTAEILRRAADTPTGTR